MFKNILKIMCVCVFVCAVWWIICTHVFKCLQKPEECIRSSGVEIIDSYFLPYEDAGYKTGDT